jgi:hypothetical protein
MITTTKKGAIAGAMGFQVGPSTGREKTLSLTTLVTAQGAVNSSKKRTGAV